MLGFQLSSVLFAEWVHEYTQAAGSVPVGPEGMTEMKPGFWIVHAVLSWNVICFHQAMVSCHMLSELEEVIQYKLVPERREIIRQIWWERLQVSLVESPVPPSPLLQSPLASTPCLLTETRYTFRAEHPQTFHLSL